MNEAKAILRAFRNAFPNTAVWARADEGWIMMGIKSPGRRVEEGKFVVCGAIRVREMTSDASEWSSRAIRRLVPDGRRRDRSHHGRDCAVDRLLSQAPV